MPPSYQAGSFNCPHCRALTQQTWYYATSAEQSDSMTSISPRIAIAECFVCSGRSIWREYTKRLEGLPHSYTAAEMLYPAFASVGPPRHPDLPADLHDLYDEASAVLPVSPRAASALVRLTLEGLLNDLYPKESDLNKMIGAAAADGLPDEVIKAMDVLRFAGNRSIHEIRTDDTVETATALFHLLNLVTERLITQPKQITALHEAMPEGLRQAIERRDAPKE